MSDMRQTISSWIKISSPEDLPPFGKRVHVYNEGWREPTIAAIRELLIEVTPRAIFRWSWALDDGIELSPIAIDTSTVTHWQPLANLPTEETVDI